jgi:hypothetical protein
VDDDILTEAQAAELIGWTAANLRSHRLRLEAERLAARLSPQDQRTVQAVRLGWRRSEPPALECGASLFRPRGDAWELTQHGLEVARRLGEHHRRAPEPPPADVRPGRVRYSRAAVLAWLDQHPEVSGRAQVTADTWGYGETARAIGIAIGTLRTWVSRAAVSRRKLDAGAPDPGGQLARHAARVPPWTWAGAERRWIPQQVTAWVERRGKPRGRDPLARPDPGGDLLTEDEAAAVMGIAPVSLAGYQARARAALRRLEGVAYVRPVFPVRAPTPEHVHRGPVVVRPCASVPSPICAAMARLARDVRRSQASPPYVVRAGVRLYVAADVQAWVAKRGHR